MRAPPLLRVLALFFATALCACGDTERPEAPPNSDGGITFPPSPPGSGSRDGGTGTDAGTILDASDQDGDTRPPGCIAPGLGNQFTAQQSGAFLNVPVQSAFAQWDCARGDLVIGLSDGSCSPASGTQLQIVVAREGINSFVIPGVNVLQEAPADTLLSAALLFRSGTDNRFGTCAGSSGLVDFDDLSGTAGGTLSGSFDMTLTSCDGDSDPAIVLLGTFNVTLVDAFETACGS